VPDLDKDSKERRKPKFHAGQVVRCRDGSYGKLVTPRVAKPLQYSGRVLFTDGNAYVLGAKDGWYHISDIRPLNKREVRR